MYAGQMAEGYNILRLQALTADKRCSTVANRAVEWESEGILGGVGVGV
jgi:hypothetical protein